MDFDRALIARRAVELAGLRAAADAEIADAIGHLLRGLEANPRALTDPDLPPLIWRLRRLLTHPTTLPSWWWRRADAIADLNLYRAMIRQSARVVVPALLPLHLPTAGLELLAEREAEVQATRHNGRWEIEGDVNVTRWPKAGERIVRPVTRWDALSEAQLRAPRATLEEVAKRWSGGPDRTIVVVEKPCTVPYAGTVVVSLDGDPHQSDPPPPIHSMGPALRAYRRGGDRAAFERELFGG